jgi:hypothetical protein
LAPGWEDLMRAIDKQIKMAILINDAVFWISKAMASILALRMVFGHKIGFWADLVVNPYWFSIFIEHSFWSCFG